MLTTPADKAFSRAIRESYEWTCQRCGTIYTPPTKALHCMHFKTRGNWSTRFIPDNAAAGCYGCHRYIDGHAAEKDMFFLKNIGEGRFEEIERIANTPAHGIKRQLKDIAKHYREEYARIRELREEGKTGYIELIEF